MKPHPKNFRKSGRRGLECANWELYTFVQYMGELGWTGLESHPTFTLFDSYTLEGGEHPW